VSFLKFRNDLSKQLDIMAAEYGSTKTQSFNLPAGIKRICIVDTYDASINNIPVAPGPDFDPVLIDDISAFVDNDQRASVMKSIFLLDKSVEKSFIVPTRIDIKDATNGDTLDFLGSVKLRFDGLGNGVRVSEAT
ncbi:hypothetical protein HYU10_05505, partial [Candidatus Woesearchaeota archaeon]|nr:hypothetical protein [Candidatus Woesearchaeota archaeon]